MVRMLNLHSFVGEPWRARINLEKLSSFLKGKHRIDETITIYRGWCPQMFLALGCIGSVQGRASLPFALCAGYAVSCSSMFLNSTRLTKLMLASIMKLDRGGNMWEQVQRNSGRQVANGHTDLHSPYNPQYQTDVSKHVHFRQWNQIGTILDTCQYLIRGQQVSSLERSFHVIMFSWKSSCPGVVNACWTLQGHCPTGFIVILMVDIV